MNAQYKILTEMEINTPNTEVMEIVIEEVIKKLKLINKESQPFLKNFKINRIERIDNNNE